MSYTVKSVNGCTKKFEFNFATLDLTNEIKDAVARKQKTANLKGFRAGKAPLHMIEKFFGPQIESDALNQFVQSQLFQAISTEKVRTVGYPEFENVKYEAGKSVSFDAIVETFPEVKLADYSKYSFNQDKVEVTEEDLSKMVKNYLGSKSEMKEVGDAASTLSKGQFAVLNFAGVKENGDRPENMKGSDYLLEIGSNQFIPGFEDGMVGMKKGEKKNIALTFPADYHANDLQNAKVTFEVELLEIKEKTFPEFTDELAKEFGFESVNDFNEKNKATIQSQKERQVLEKLHQEILEKFVKENTFDLPKSMVESQEQFLKEDLTRTLKAQGFNDFMVDEYFKRWKSDMTTKAEFQVRSSLILDTLANEFKVETTEADFEKKIEESAKSANLDINMVKSYYTSNEKIKNNMMYAIREEKTFEALKQKIKIV